MIKRFVIGMGLAGMLAACVEEPVDGRQAFLEDCAVCHGADARGGAIDLDPPAPDLTGLTLANRGTFPRNQVMNIIDGLVRHPQFSNAMPEFGAGDMGDTVIVENEGLGTPVPERLLALTEYLESIQR